MAVTRSSLSCRRAACSGCRRRFHSDRKCVYCQRGNEQFCVSGEMMGKYRDGGYAEFIVMPSRSVFRLPEEIPFEQGAIMMCSSSTSLHALNKARLRPGETVAVFGVGGLGLSAIQLAKVLGAREVFAVDIRAGKLALAEQFRSEEHTSEL